MIQRATDLISRLMQVGIRFIGAAGPEETFQAIAFAPRHDMHVQVRHALAHLIVDCHERAFGFHSRFDCALQILSGLEQRPYKLVWKIRQRYVVLNRDQQHVSRKQRSVIQKCKCAFGVPHNLRRRASRGDLAERTRHLFRAESRCSR